MSALSAEYILHIWGGEGERDQGQQDPPEDQDGDDPQDQGNAPDNDDDDSKDDPPDDKAKDGEKSLEDQLDEEKRARLKAERALAKKEKDAKDAEADKDAVKDRDKYKAKVEARDKFLTENLLIMEINKQKKYDFIDVEDVIRAFKGDEVTIDLDADEPTVEGLDLALKRIAKDKPHFLKKSKDDEEDLPPSGGHPRGGKADSQQAEDAELGRKYKIPGYGTQAMVRPV